MSIIKAEHILKDVKRISVLDAFRGLAASSVVLFHYTSRYFVKHPENYHGWFKYSYGNLGVQLFFIISGFVIFMTVKSSLNVKDFLIKRFSRLYPTFWFAVIFTYSLINIFPNPDVHITVMDFIGNLTMLPYLFHCQMVDGPYWSLIPEFFFYLLLCLVIKFNLQDKIYTWCVPWLIISFINYLVYTFPDKVQILFSAQWGFLFISGIMFYKIKFENSKNLTPHIIISLCILLAYIKYESDIYAFVIILLIYALFYCFIYERLNFLSTKPLLFLGRISFPLYLIHEKMGFIIFNYFHFYLKDFYYYILIGTITLAIFLAYLIHVVIEVPSTNWLRKKIYTNLTYKTIKPLIG